MLTGYRLSWREIDWLRTMGWQFELNGNCRPVIARRFTKNMLGFGSDTNQPKLPQPDFYALRGAWSDANPNPDLTTRSIAL